MSKNYSLKMIASQSITEQSMIRIISINQDLLYLNDYALYKTEIIKISSKGGLHFTTHNKPHFDCNDITLLIQQLNQDCFAQVCTKSILLLDGTQSKYHQIEDLLEQSNIMIDCCLVFERMLVLICSTYMFMYEVRGLNLVSLGVQCVPANQMKLYRLNELDCMLMLGSHESQISQFDGGLQQFAVLDKLHYEDLKSHLAIQLIINFTKHQLNLFSHARDSKLLLILVCNDAQGKFEHKTQSLDIEEESVQIITMAQLPYKSTHFLILIHTYQGFHLMIGRQKTTSNDLSRESITQALQIQVWRAITDFNYLGKCHQHSIIMVRDGLIYEIQSDKINTWEINTTDGMKTSTSAYNLTCSILQKPHYLIRTMTDRVEIINLQMNAKIWQLPTLSSLDGFTCYYAPHHEQFLLYRNTLKYALDSNNRESILRFTDLLAYNLGTHNFSFNGVPTFNADNGNQYVLQGYQLSLVHNVHQNFYLALNDRKIILFALNESQIVVLTSFGVVNEERLQFRNQLSIEDLDQMDFSDDNPLLPIQFMEMVRMRTTKFSHGFEFRVDILIGTTKSIRVASIECPKSQHQFTKEQKFNGQIDEVALTRGEDIYVIANKQEIYKLHLRDNQLTLTTHYICDQNVLLYGRMLSTPWDEEVDFILKSNHACLVTAKNNPQQIIQLMTMI